MNSFDLENGPRHDSGFKTPDGYFDGLEDQVMARLMATEPKVIPLFTRHRKTIYAVAAILVLALMIPLYNLLTKPSENIEDAALEHYLAYESGLNQFDLLTVLEPEDIQKLQEQSELPVSDEAIEYQLYGNNIEHIITE